MTTRYETFTTAATDLFNAGFSSKSAQKVALDDVSRAYNELRAELADACLSARNEVEGTRDDGSTFTHYEMTDAVKAVYWDVPSYPHQFKAKHAELVRAAFGDRFEALLALVAETVALRDAIKAAPVVPPVKDESRVLAARVVEGIKELMERRKAQYLEAIDLTEILGDKIVIHGLTANSHYVRNEHGTTFLRTFFYLRGKLTPLNSILAGAEEAERRAKA